MNPELANYIKQGLRLLLMTKAISTASADEILIALYTETEDGKESIAARILHETEHAFCLDILYKSVWLSKRAISIQEKYDDVIMFTLRIPELAEIKEIIP